VIVQPAPAQGDALLRAALARRALARGLAHGPDDIVVTNGASEAINLALRAVAQPGDLVAVDSPTHYILLQQIESLGMRAIEIPATASAGMSIEALDMALRMRPGVRAVVTVPTFQNRSAR
jgi:DNA-binding transcriptional MocR family regulator